MVNKQFQYFMAEFKHATRSLSSSQVKHMRSCPDFTLVPVHRNVDFQLLSTIDPVA